MLFFFFFFFQAEDGIRDYKVTGVQTCALPIFDRSPEHRDRLLELADGEMGLGQTIAGLDVHAALAKLGGDVERLLARGQRAAMIADVAEPRSHVGQDESQPASIAELTG